MIQKKISTTWPLLFAEPEEADFSSKELARIRVSLQGNIDAQKVPDLVTLVARHRKIVHCKSQDYMDLESKKPV